MLSRGCWALTIVLDEQGKESEALKELQAHRSVMCRRDWKQKVKSFFGAVDSEGGYIKRALLVNLLIRQGDSDKVLGLDLLPDLDGIQSHGGKNEDKKEEKMIEWCSENLVALARLLFEQKRNDAAIDLLRRRMKAHDKIFGASHHKTKKATSDLIFMLADMGAENVDKAIRLSPSTLDDSSEETNAEALLLRTAYAFALCKKTRFDDAIAEMDLVLQYKKRVWTHGEYVTESCMSDLASGLFVQGEREYQIPAAMEHELLMISKKVQSQEAKAQIIAILCNFSRPGGLGDVLAMMRVAKDDLRDKPSDRRIRMKIQGFIVFILANLGLCFENKIQVDEALDLGTALKEEVVEKPGWDEIDRVFVMRTLTSVYSIKILILCQFHGFGNHDLDWMDRVDKLYGEVHLMACKAVGHTHQETLLVANRWSVHALHHRMARANARGLSHSADDESHFWSHIFLSHSEALDKYDFQIDGNYWSQKGYLAEDFGTQHPGVLRRVEREARQHFLVDSNRPDRKFGIRNSLIQVYQKLRIYYRRRNKNGSFRNPDFHPQIIRTLEALAQAYWREGKTFQALATSKYVVLLARKTFANGDNHPCTIAYRILLMKPLLQDDVMFPKKVETARELLKLCVETFGKQHTQTISCMNELGVILCEQAQKNEATGLMQEALELGLPFLGVHHSIVSQSWNNLLVAMNYSTCNSEDLWLRIFEIVEELALRGSSMSAREIFGGMYIGASETQKGTLGIEAYGLLHSLHQVRRMTLGAVIFGENHQFTKSVRDSFGLLLWKGCNLSIHQAFQVMENLKDMPKLNLKYPVMPGTGSHMSLLIRRLQNINTDTREKILGLKILGLKILGLRIRALRALIFTLQLEIPTIGVERIRVGFLHEYWLYSPTVRAHREDMERILQEDMERILREDIERILREDMERILQEDMERILREDIERTILEDIERILREDMERILREDIERILREDIERTILEDMERILLEHGPEVFLKY